MPKRVAMLAYPDVQILDVVGPLEVFARTSRWLRDHRRHERDAYDVEIVGLARGVFRASSGLRLYADRGFGDVTLRDIVAEANVNLAAVNYHFGSKDELIAELFVTRSLALNKERLRELREAEEAGDGRADRDVDAGRNSNN